MKIVTLSPKKFDEFATTHKYRNYYQTSNYGNLMINFGYNVHYLGILNDSNALIGATLIIYKDVFMGNKIAYAPRGFLFDFEDKEQTLLLSDKLKQLLGKQGFMLLRMDPYIISTIRDQKGNIINFNNQTNIIQSNLESANFNYKGKSLYFENEKPRWESLILLNKNTNILYKELDKRIRHKIKKATISGIEIIKDNNLDKIYNFIKNKNHKPLRYYKELINNYNCDIYIANLNTETFVINSRKLYENEMNRNDVLAKKIQSTNTKGIAKRTILNSKMESDKLLNIYKNNLVQATKLLKENPKGLIVGGGIVLNYDNAAYLIIEGFDKNYSFLNSNYLLKWQMILDYKEKNYKYLNLNAVVGEFEKDNKYKGLNESKLGYKSLITEYIGEFDIILNNFTYSIYKNFRKDKK